MRSQPASPWGRSSWPACRPLCAASPTALVLACALAVALSVLLLIRRVRPGNRLDVHRALGIGVVLLGAVAYLFRERIFETVNAATALANRSALWSEVLRWVERRAIQGWGWYGDWLDEPFPFRTVNFLMGAPHESALNAYLDVTLQLGAVGLILFGGMCALAFARGWVMASERRSSVYLWMPLMLTVILGDISRRIVHAGGPRLAAAGAVHRHGGAGQVVAHTDSRQAGHS